MQSIGGVLGNQRQLKIIAPRLVAVLTGHLPAIPDTVPQCQTCKYFDTRHEAFKAYAEECGDLDRHISGIYPIAHCKCEIANFRRQREQRNEVLVNRANANLPAFPVKQFDSFRQRPGTEAAWEAARRWAAGEGPHILVLEGTTGAGKSHLIEAALRSALAAGHRARYEYTPELLNNLRLSYDRESAAKTASVLEHAIQAEYLGLDDIALERGTTWTQEQLGILIEPAVRGQRRVAVAYNLHSLVVDNLEQRLASRLLGRDRNVVRVKLECGDYGMERAQ